MKQFFFILLILFYIVSSVYAVGQHKERFQEIQDSYLFSQMFFPTEEGCAKQNELISYLQAFSQTHNLLYTETPISGASYETNSVNIELYLTGTAPENGTILITVPLNSIYANGKYYDISLSQCLALQLLDNACRERPKKNLHVVFFGASSIARENTYGTEQFLKTHSGRFSHTSAILLNLSDSYAPITASASTNSKPIPALLLKKLISCMKNNDHCIKFSVDEIIRSRFNLLKTDKLLDAFLAEEVDAVLFSNHPGQEKVYGNYYNTRHQNQLFNFLQDWHKEIDSLMPTFEKDRNYLIQDFHAGKHAFYLLIPEYTQLQIYFFLLFCSLLLFRIILPFRSKTKLLQLYSAFPFFLLLFLWFYTISFMPFLFETLISFLHNLPFQYGRGMFFYFFTIFFFMQFAAFFLIDVAPRIHLPIQWKNSLYIQTAIYSAYINLFLITITDISLSYVYFLFLFFITFSMACGKNFFLKYSCYILSFAGFFFALFDLTQNSGSNLLVDFGGSLFLVHLQFCLFAFPFLLIGIHMFRINRMILGTSGEKYRTMPFLVLLFLCFFPLFFSVHYSSKGQAQNIDVSIIHDYNRKVSSISMKPSETSKTKILPKQLEFSDLLTQKHHIYTRKNKMLEIHPVQPRAYSCNVSSTGSIHTININSKLEISKLDAVLVCPKGIKPLHTSYRNLQMKEMQNSSYDLFRLLIPRNSGTNLELQLELLPEYEYTLNLEVTFSDTQLRFLILPLENSYNVSERNRESIKLK